MNAGKARASSITIVKTFACRVPRATSARSSSRAMFVQRLNSEGVPEWVVFDGGDGGGGAANASTSTSTDGDAAGPVAADPAAAAVADALAGSMYADMLHDRDRAAAYAAALAAVLGSRPGARVLDVGTGTGLLSILAARAGGTLTAVDQFPPMARLARETVEEAGLTSSITVHACRSDELDVSGQPRFDVVVSEILDSVLLGEGALPTAVDVGARLLAADGVAIPARGRVFAQAVSCPALRACWDASGWVGAPAGLGDDPNPRPLHLEGLLRDGLTTLGPPVVVLEVDLTRPTSLRGRECSRVPDGDALAVWWEVDLTPDGRMTLDTAPGWVRETEKPPRVWTDHWRACWVPCPAAAATDGGALTVEAAFGPADLVVRVVAEEEGAAPAPASLPSLSLAAAYAPAGLGLWASSLRMSVLDAAAAAAVSLHPTTTRVLTLGDGPLPALAALRAGVVDVVAVVSSSPGAADAVRRAAGGAAVVMGAPPPPPSSPNLHTLLLAEPHFRSTEARPPWEALFRFLRDQEALAVAGCFGGDDGHLLTVSPARARLMVVGAATPDLARTFAPVGQVEGVSMAAFDAASRTASTTGRWLTRAVGWQCGAYGEATERVEVGRLNLASAAVE